MKRVHLTARENWAKKVEDIGFDYHSLGKTPDDQDGVYWDETIAYELTSEEVDILESATESLHELCLQAVDYVVQHEEEMDKFCIPVAYRDYIKKSWLRRDPYIIGRFDLMFDSTTKSIKMLEYNADTPTLLIETSLVQWFWLQEKFPKLDQFNSVHEKLLDAMTVIKTRIPGAEPVYFSAFTTALEEYRHSQYYMDVAGQAGIEARFIDIPDIGWSPQGYFTDLDEKRIRFLHKLYPWEWMATDAFGEKMTLDTVGVLEPVWKMLLSNKALLPLLWKLFPNHPNLLPCYWSPEKLNGNYVAKPILAREGANISIHRSEREVVSTPGSYADTPLVYQAFYQTPKFDGNNVVIGSWVVGGLSAGIILRENESSIVVNTSKVLPHYFTSG